jgi:putative membrane protein
VLTGLLRTIARDYRYQLNRTSTGLRRRRGLFTLSEVVIPIRRVQAAIIETGWFRRLFGWWKLQYQTLGIGLQNSGHQDVAPFAQMGEIRPLLAEAGIEHLPAEADYLRVSRRFIMRRYLAAFLPLTLLVLGLGVFVPVALLLLVPLLIGAPFVVLVWRRHRYVLAHGAIYVREGLLKPRLSIVPFGRVQSLHVQRGPLQRRFGLATLEIDTAGASMLRGVAVRDLEGEAAEQLASRLLEEYLRSRREARA